MILFGCVIWAWANVGFGGNIFCAHMRSWIIYHLIPLSNPIGGRSYHHRELYNGQYLFILMVGWPQCLWNMVAHGARFHPLGSHHVLLFSRCNCWWPYLGLKSAIFRCYTHMMQWRNHPIWRGWGCCVATSRRTAVNPFDGEPRRSFFGGPTVTQAYFIYLKRVRQMHVRSKIELGTRRWQICARSTLEHWHGTCYQFNFLMFECSCCSICVGTWKTSASQPDPSLFKSRF